METRAPHEMAICAGCGVIAPLEGRRRCVICGGERPPLQVSATASAFWTAVKCTFRCRVCGHDSALNHVDSDGSVQCSRCGIEQRFEGRRWRDAIEHAHGVGDLCGPNPEGRFPSGAPLAKNPYAEIGRSETFAKGRQVSEQHRLVVRAAPGHPLCPKCGRPIAVAARTDNELSVGCSSCAYRARYRLPTGAAKWAPALSGVVASEHELDRKRVEVLDDPGGAVAIRCPNCTAPLPVVAEKSVIHCGYCGIAARIPGETLRRLGRESSEPELWWMLFSGPSELRALLERRHREAAQRAEKYARREADRERERERALERARALARPAASHVSTDQRPAKRHIALALLVAMLMLTAGVVYALMQRAQRTSAPALSQPPSAAVRGPAPAATAAPPKLALEWRGKLTRAEGKPLARGSECSAKLEADGAQIRWLAVSCGDQRLYDSRTPLNGMSMKTAVLGEAPHADHPGKLGYAVVYRDTGTRTGRAELQLDTTHRQAIVSSGEIPEFRVEIAFETTSLPRAGAPIFQTPARIVPLSLKLSPQSSSGWSTPIGGECRLEIAFVNSQASAVTCGAELVCGKRWLYGKQGSPGFLPCKLGQDEKPISASDSQPPSADGTPALELDLAARRVSLSSEEDARRAEFSIEP